MPKSNESDQEKPSKSQLKKEMLALQKTGETLVNLSDSQLAILALPEELLDSIRLARSLKSHEAKRRQLQYIGKLMRNLDPEPIHAGLKTIQMAREQEKTKFHEVEAWRDQLISEGDAALQKFCEGHPEADRQHLRQLLRKAQQDLINNKNSGGKTALFDYLRGLLH